MPDRDDADLPVVPAASLVGGNQVELLQGGDELFPAMVAAMAGARREEIGRAHV